MGRMKDWKEQEEEEQEGNPQWDERARVENGERERITKE